jgi:hypothetical protein
LLLVGLELRDGGRLLLVLLVGGLLVPHRLGLLLALLQGCGLLLLLLSQGSLLLLLESHRSLLLLALLLLLLLLLLLGLLLLLLRLLETELLLGLGSGLLLAEELRGREQESKPMRGDVRSSFERRQETRKTRGASRFIFSSSSSFRAPSGARAPAAARPPS